MVELKGPLAATMELNGPGALEDRAGADFLTGAQWKAIIDKFVPYANSITIGGEEPTLHPNFQEILKHADLAKLGFSVATTGRWREPRTVIGIVREMAYFHAFLIALPAADAETYKTLTGVDALAEVVSNMKLATASAEGVFSLTLLSRPLLGRLREVTMLALAQGAWGCRFQRPINAVEPWALTPVELTQALDELAALQYDGYPVSIDNCVPKCFHDGMGHGCGAGFTSCLVDRQGRLKACHHAEEACGNLLDSPLDALWKSPAMRRWRKAVPKECSRCSMVFTCEAGCRAAGLAGREKDGLVRGPYTPPAGGGDAPTVTMSGHLCPVPKFTIREEAFGGILIGKAGDVLPVTSEGLAIAQAYTGSTPLAAIERQFGDTGLSFTYALYGQNMIELRQIEELPTLTR